ncbi:MAG: nucleotidyltransferase [Planctomycetes bacterium]|nr:nucleotidyltransferase [Planctomycetota bacterium]
MPSPRVDALRDKVAGFCRKWRVTELALFGSVLREDFGPDSDIDVLASFAPGAHWSLWDHYEMEQELGALLGRRVDLLTRRSVEQSQNWIRRKAILESAETIYGRG